MVITVKQQGVVNQMDCEKVKEGYKTCPFDLCLTDIEGIIECLNTNFKDFCNTNYLQYNVDSNLIGHLKYGVGL